MPEKLETKNIYKLEISEWEKNALIQIVQNGNFQGKDIKPLAELLTKIEGLKEDK